jgi:CHAT domain-containing protein
VGGVQYDQQPKAQPPGPDAALLRSAVAGLEKVRWPELPGTLKELQRVLALAGQRKSVRLEGAEASTTRLLQELPQARWAHLATHGFFADKRLRSALQVDPALFDRSRFTGERALAGARNPLVLSGLVLAGANLPPPKDLSELLRWGGGILTAEAIAGLPLQQLELAVLSTCDSGLGEVGGGEGVYGLQRAFHLAGTHNVVASLWKVDDEATSALMGLFYAKLWGKKPMAPLQALRDAQLYLYYHPEQIPELARARDPDLSQILPVTGDPPAPRPKGKAAVKLWAGFQLSGTGQ